MSETNYLLDREFGDQESLAQLVRDISAANPGKKWTRRTEMMGDIASADVYFFDGKPVFEVTRPGLDCDEYNDLRFGKNELAWRIAQSLAEHRIPGVVNAEPHE